ncbi:hypothetical protein [Gordonia malaquae]|uniref:hypothetical protein n=1 Tax=Gordonia malaquae TaxID=410332 RepID=UPI0030FE1A4C
MADDNVITAKPRERVRALLAEAADGLDAHEVGRALDVHVTTARFHLKNLVDEGTAVTVQLAPEGVGRPRVAYRIAPQPAADELGSLLLMQLGATAQQREDAAAVAGRDWARMHAAPPQALPPDPVIAVEAALTRLGFRVTGALSQFGRHRVNVCSCPLKHLAGTVPEIARGVVRGAVEESLAAASPILDRTYAVHVEPDASGNCSLTLILT